jgi:hypothetical protein
MSAILEIHCYNCCTDYADLRKLWSILPKFDESCTPIFSDTEIKTPPNATWILSVSTVHNFDLVKLEYPTHTDLECPNPQSLTGYNFIDGVVSKIKSAFPDSTLMILTEATNAVLVK